MFSEITPAALFPAKEQGHIVVDVRSPSEYKEATIPGAINIPLFSDAERAEVGTLYKQAGPEQATALGLELFSKKLPAFIAAFKQLAQPVTVFCWRGGMRSKTAATVLDLMGISVNRLSGGIRAYRDWLKIQRATLPLPTFYVLNGHTGSGKTHILHHLTDAGYPVIDLEAMAGHRGSIFGEIGQTANNQRMFDFLLTEALLRYQAEAFVLIEGESQRIGKVMLPERFYQHKEESEQWFIELPMNQRVDLILADYTPDVHHLAFTEAFQFIKRRIHTPVAAQIEKAFEDKAYHTVVELLLTHYYDPRYNHSTQYPGQQTLVINAQTITEAIMHVEEILTQHKAINNNK